ncbi:MAG: flagellin [Phycisphaeraceae bacterium]|nr:flagellin [Phycisphaeraceae bacterium]
MTRINTNIGSLVAQQNLAKSNRGLETSLQRLSTGLSINRGADNPAGLIVSERLRSEISATEQAMSNIERASNVIATTEASLSEISNLLIDIQALIVEAANTGGFSQEEIEANQLQIDSAIDSITRISNSTTFAGLKLLNGNLEYITSGVDPAVINDVKISSVNWGTAETIPMTVEVIASAETAQLFISGGGNPLNPGTFLSSVSFEVTGPTGVQVISVASGTPLSAVVFNINQVADATGVSAYLVDPLDPTSGMVLNSQTVGSDAFVSVRKLDSSSGAFFQTFDSQGGAPVLRDTGEDVLALVNGNLALGDGETISLRSQTVNLEMTLTRLASQTLGTTEYTIIGGGADFQIGPSIDTSQRVGFGIGSVAASHLGNQTVGFLNSVASGGENSLVAGQQAEASMIVEEAIDQIAVLRGRLGAFERNTLDTTYNSQSIALENLTASESRVRDTDFAKETAELTRSQVLVSAGTSVLALANNTSQSVLSLLQ